jgi:thiamine biosynthesis lipoprotein
LSRFRRDSDIARIAHLAPGEKMRLSEPAFACLEIAKSMERATHSAFCPTPAALKTQPSLPQWDLLPDEHSVLCVSGQLAFDLGAIGKGFALDRMSELLRQWDCPSFLLVAGGSSILTGDPPADTPGWSCGLGEDNASQRFFLAHASLSGSGLAVKGTHILDPRTGCLALRQKRAWVLADSAAESDALSTACMVLRAPELEEVLAQNHSWLAFLETEEGARPVGNRALPVQA